MSTLWMFPWTWNRELTNAVWHYSLGFFARTIYKFQVVKSVLGQTIGLEDTYDLFVEHWDQVRLIRKTRQGLNQQI
jgi:hypothetical protein